MECSSVSKENEISEKPAQLLFSFPEASLDAGTTWRCSPASCAPDPGSTLLTHPSFVGLSSAPEAPACHLGAPRTEGQTPTSLTRLGQASRRPAPCPQAGMAVPPPASVHRVWPDNVSAQPSVTLESTASFPQLQPEWSREAQGPGGELRRQLPAGRAGAGHLQRSGMTAWMADRTSSLGQGWAGEAADGLVSYPGGGRSQHPEQARVGLEKSFVAEGGRGIRAAGELGPDSALTRMVSPRPEGTYSHRMMLLTRGLWGREV